MHELPDQLLCALAKLAEGQQVHTLERDARTLSENYRLRTGTGRRLVTASGEAAAYALSRMPATYASAHAALGEALKASGLAPSTLLDCGAGTGAATFAAADLLTLSQIICLEREEAMCTQGLALMHGMEGALEHVDYRAWNLADDAPLPKAELVCAGYMLGELAEEARIPTALRLFAAAQQMLLLIEPGTPQGFVNLRCVREALKAQGAFVAAPCPAGASACPIQGDDWCHFAVRVQRTRLHRALKGGQAPYEDEKFIYMAFTRMPPKAACKARILRHPQVAPGRITLTLCQADGTDTRVVTARHADWKRSRKAVWGETLP